MNHRPLGKLAGLLVLGAVTGCQGFCADVTPAFGFGARVQLSGLADIGLLASTSLFSIQRYGQRPPFEENERSAILHHYREVVG